MHLLVFHVLPSIISSLLFFIIASVAILIFRIKHPAIITFLYILVLYKSAEVLLMKSVVIAGTHFTLGFKIIDPLSIIPSVFDPTGLPSIRSGPIYDFIIAVLFAACFMVIIYRWFKLWRFYLNLPDNNFISASDCHKIFNIIEKYVKLFKVTKPRVALSLSNYSLPAIVGFFRPVLVLSPKMIDLLSEENLEIIIAHEISHIKRKDNCFQWLALACRDLTFFNPLSYYIFNKYLIYKEIAADNLVKIKTQITEKQIKDCLREVKKFVKENKLKDLPSVSYLFVRKDEINYFNDMQFKLNNIKIFFSTIFFTSLLIIQFLLILPVGK